MARGAHLERLLLLRRAASGYTADMHKLLTRAAVAISLCAFAAAQTNTTSTQSSQSQTAPPAQNQPTPAFTPPVHRKPQSFQPGEDPREHAAVKQAQSTQTPPEFDHLGLEVRDIAKSADFYQRVMGFVQIPDPFNDAQHIFLRLGQHSQLHLVKRAATASSTTPANSASKSASSLKNSFHFAVRVADVPAFAARLDKLKVAYSDTNEKPHTITKRPDGVSQIYFQDPDGYWIEVNDDKY
jgi:lactoylglutathione lyase